MKQYWQKLSARIDAMSLRERGMIFAMSAVILLALINSAILDPQFTKQKQLSQKVKMEQEQISALQAEIQQKLAGQQVDPDAANKMRMQQLKVQMDQMHVRLADMQKSLVSPDRMGLLLDDILRRNGKLHLVSLKTLPISSLDETPEGKNQADRTTAVATTAPATGKDKTSDASIIGSVYRHGVEIVLQGNYLDMVTYMSELESMPWQLFWGRAKLHVDEYPTATLTLTLFTLSLDKKWLNL